LATIFKRLSGDKRTTLTFWIPLLLSVFAPSLRASELTPVNVGHTNDGGNAYGITIAGNYAYLANFNDGLRIYDISNPGHPVSVGHANNGFASGIAVDGNFAYVADSSDGLRIYDISNPAIPISVGNTNNGASALGVAVSGNFAYLANNNDGLRVYDVSNHSTPENVGHATNNNSANSSSVAVSGHFAYLANNSDGLRIYDVSDPAICTNIGAINDTGLAFGVAIAGNYAYLANGFDGLHIYDVSTPTNPLSVGHAFISAGNSLAVAVSGTYAFLANFDDGLHIYNVSQVFNPRQIATINNGGFARGIAVSGNYACLANGSDGLRVYLLQPVLSLSPTGTNSLLASWPAFSLGFVLQQSSDLAAGNWSNVTNPPVNNAGQNQVNLPTSSGPAYFRLALTPPQLSIAGDSTGVTVSWPAYFTGYALQQSPDPATGNWTTMTNAPLSVGGQNQFSASPPSGNQFYRLISQ
jgi:hypothetical protein